MLDGLSRYRRVEGLVKSADPEHRRMVSGSVMTLLVTIVQIVVVGVVVLLILDIFES